MYKLKILFLTVFVLFNTKAAWTGVIPAPDDDPHYTKVGFFDIHVCNWQDHKDLFFMILFSTYEFKNIDKIELFTPEKIRIGALNSEKYRLVLEKKKPEKRVFINTFDIPTNAGDGWYTSIITMKDGKQYEARDFVVVHKMGVATDLNPPDKAVLDTPPAKLSWKAIPGAKHYQVFIKDSWEERIIYSSKNLSKPELVLPKGLLKHNGIYSWRVHARDVNENVLLGDFNHGSLNLPSTFTVD